MKSAADVAPPSSEIRQIRCGLNVSQSRFAEMLGVSVETYRPWDSGRRPTPEDVIARARALVHRPTSDEPMLLADLARVLGIHVKTLRTAARYERLSVVYDTRRVYGNLVPRATLAAGEAFKQTHYPRWTPKTGH